MDEVWKKAIALIESRILTLENDHKSFVNATIRNVDLVVGRVKEDGERDQQIATALWDGVQDIHKKINGIHEQIESFRAALLAIQNSMNIIRDSQVRMQQDRMKYDHLYYHIFPDRAENDFKIGNQLDAIKIKSSPDGKGKKS